MTATQTAQFTTGTLVTYGGRPYIIIQTDGADVGELAELHPGDHFDAATLTKDDRDHWVPVISLTRRNAASAAGYQKSDYSGVSTADLYTIFRTISKVPARTPILAIIGRVRAEWDRRNREERDAVIRAYVEVFDV